MWFWRPLFFHKTAIHCSMPSQGFYPSNYSYTYSEQYVTDMSLAMILFLNWLIFCFYYQKLPKCSRSRERLYTFEFWLLTFSLKIIKINVYGSKKHSYYRYKPLSYMYLRYLINHTMYAISSMCIQCTSIKKKQENTQKSRAG